MITGQQSRPLHMRPAPRTTCGAPSADWLIVQAAQLAWEIRAILHFINGTRLNLAEELIMQSKRLRGS
jgi:hypothetical protein